MAAKCNGFTAAPCATGEKANMGRGGLDDGDYKPRELKAGIEVHLTAGRR